jgi:glycosyltransferase involved in cell wall biosynthesis
MKIFFDARYIRTDFHDGISRYSTELGQALSKLTDITFIICDKAQLKLLPNDAKFVQIHKPTSALEPLSALILNRYHPDVVFSPMQMIGSFGRHFKLILTLHDLIYYHHRTPPSQFSPLVRLGWWLFYSAWWPQRLVLNHADIIATVSRTSREQILKAKLTKRPVVVIPNAPQQLSKLLDHSIDTNLQPNNLVYMGSFMAYKNVETLISGLEFLPGYELHLLSHISSDRRHQLESISPVAATRLVFHDGVSDKEYASTLANRSLLVIASLDEGYGLPIAEAQAMGVPAVISDIPIFHEVAGDGALYFDPNDPKDFAEKVNQATTPKTYHKLVQNSHLQSQKFSWSGSAEVLLKTINQLQKNR